MDWMELGEEEFLQNSWMDVFEQNQVLQTMLVHWTYRQMDSKKQPVLEGAKVHFAIMASVCPRFVHSGG